MAKNSVRDFDATAANNTDIQSVDIAENCAPSGINNAIRELMADIKDVSAGTVALESPQADSLTVTGDLTVDTNTLFVDASADAVGVNATTLDASLQIGALNTTGTDRGAVSIKTEASGATIGESAIYIEEQSGAEGYYVGVNSDGAMFFSNSGASTPTLLLGDDDNVGIGTSPSVKLDIDNGSLKVNRGNSSGDIAVFRGLNAEKVKIDTDGIKFNGDTAAANALDDYEEGTWTATSGTGTLTSNDTRYVKIGKQVTLFGYLSAFSDRSSSNGVAIGGLPFASGSDNRAVGAAFVRYLNVGGDAVSAYIPSGTSTMSFYASRVNDNYLEVKHSHLSSTLSNMFFTITYQV